MSTPGTWLSACLTVTATLVLAGGCSRAIDPVRLSDAQLAVRVKTALVNDPVVGAFPIEVQVTSGGMVRLSGRLESDAQRQRVLEVVRAVDGVRGMQSVLTVGATTPAPPEAERSVPLAPGPVPAADTAPNDRRLLGVGLSVNLTRPMSADLDRSIRVSPLIRIGSGTGVGVAIGFGWFATDLYASETSNRLGTLKIKPIMAGAGYDVRRDRISTGVSIVGGIAFNSVDPDRREAASGLAVDVSDSLVLRSGMSVWVDLDSRTALNVFGGYLMTRPRATFFEEGRIETRTVRVDAGLLRVGFVYKLF